MYKFVQICTNLYKYVQNASFNLLFIRIVSKLAILRYDTSRNITMSRKDFSSKINKNKNKRRLKTQINKYHHFLNVQIIT